jgi:preprotein translocase subunit YajC
LIGTTSFLFDSAAAGPSLIQNVVLGVGILVLVYFFMLRPQSQERKKVEEMLSTLQKGDRVVTRGGVLGRVVSVADAAVVLEVADKVHVTFEKAAIMSRERPGSEAPSSDKSGK